MKSLLNLFGKTSKNESIYDTVFIHYGSNSINNVNIKPITTHSFMIAKPFGGFWGSPKKSKNSWKRFCKENEFPISRKHFCFRIKPNAKVLILDSVEKFSQIPYCNGFPQVIEENNRIVYWEKIFEEYDAVVFDYEKCFSFETSTGCDLWDCDSIVVKSKDVIEEI